MATGSQPQSCYPEEIATLRGMLDEMKQRLEERRELLDKARPFLGPSLTERRIEALTTAIEALGGAL